MLTDSHRYNKPAEIGTAGYVSTQCSFLKYFTNNLYYSSSSLSHIESRMNFSEIHWVQVNYEEFRPHQTNLTRSQCLSWSTSFQGQGHPAAHWAPTQHPPPQVYGLHSVCSQMCLSLQAATNNKNEELYVQDLKYCWQQPSEEGPFLPFGAQQTGPENS